MPTKLSILFAFFVQWLAVPVSHATVVDRIMAIVNDDIITLSDFKSFKQQFDQKGTDAEILDALINERLTRQIVKKLDLVPEHDEVEAQITSILKLQGITRDDLRSFLKERGMTYEKYRTNIQRSMENERLLSREIKTSINITEQDIRSHYYNHVKGKKPKMSYHVRQLFFPTDTEADSEEKLKLAKTAHAESKQDASFEKIYKKYTADRNQLDTLGDLGFISEDDLIAPLKKAVKQMRSNQISEPVVSDIGIHILQLLDIRQEATQSYEEAKPAIERTLYEREFKKLLDRWIKTKREEAYIKIIPPGKKSSKQ